MQTGITSVTRQAIWFSSTIKVHFIAVFKYSRAKLMMIQNQEQSLLVMIDPVPLQPWSVIEEQNNT